MSYTVRTVSQLPELENIKNEDLFQVSEYLNNQAYDSKKIKYENIYNNVKSNILTTLGEEYQLGTDTMLSVWYNFDQLWTNNIGPLWDNFSNLSSNVTEMNGRIPNWNIKNTTSFVSQSINNKYSGNEDDFYTFRFDSNEISKNSSEKTIRKTGNFFCYGWITAPKVIDPADAWVGIEAKNKNNDWMLIALQPWAVSQNSNIMQYVGFNCPVQAGMTLRITTGFTITDFSRSFAGRGLVINLDSTKTNSNINNTFIGYVLG